MFAARPRPRARSPRLSTASRELFFRPARGQTYRLRSAAIAFILSPVRKFLLSRIYGDVPARD